MAHLHLGMNIREKTKTASMLSVVYGQTQARYRVSKSLGLPQRFLDVLALPTSAFNPNDDFSELICHYYSGEG